MNIKSLGGVLTPNQGFISFRCRLGNGTINLGRALRYQPTTAQSGISDAISHFPLEKSGDSQNPLEPNSKPLSEKRQPKSILDRKNAATEPPSYTVGLGPREDTGSSKPGQSESDSRAQSHTQFSQSKQGQIREAASSGKAKASTKGDEANASKKREKAKASTKGNQANASKKREKAKASTKGNQANASKKGDKARASKKRRKVKDVEQDKPAEVRGLSTIINISTVKAVKKKDANEKMKSKMREASRCHVEIHRLRSRELEVSAINPKKLSLPSLSFGLERVLFNPGVYNLQDPRSRVFNFDPYLQTIMPVEEFNFNALNKFTTSSKDEHLLEIGRAYGKRYVGSSSSITSVLVHFHYLLSQWRQIDASMISKGFTDADKLTGFAPFQKLPSAVFLRWKDGTYAIDADMEFDKATVLSSLGNSMEKLLTTDAKDFERYRRSNSDQVSSNEIDSSRTHRYSTLGNILMRSQLDAYDARLPGTGVFDIKTRSVVSIRLDVQKYKLGVGYQIKFAQGDWESYEREYFDMIRSAFLKYSLQMRMGRMDGVFVAYHNIERIFGFQYISLPEMDKTLHGTSDTLIGDQEFRMSLGLFNVILDKATKKYPETSLRIHFKTREIETPYMSIFAEPMTDVQIQKIQLKQAAQVEQFERSILGLKGGALSKEDQQDKEVEWADIESRVQEAMSRDEKSPLDGNMDQVSSFAVASNMKPNPIHNRNDPGGSLYRDNTIKDHDNENLTAPSIVGDGQMDTGDREGDEVTREHEDDKEVEKASHEFDEEVNGDEAEDNAGENAVRETDEDEKERNHNENGGLSEIHTGGEHQAMNKTVVLDNAGRANIDKQSQQTLTDDDSCNTTEVSDLDVPGEVLAMILGVRNRVNGDYVQRPVQLGPTDDWAIEYSLTEEEDVGRARSLYQACKRQRREQHEDSENGKVGPLVKILRKISREGATWKKQMDKKDKTRPRVVLKRRLMQQGPAGQ
ncbi:hypothetical protein MMC29_006286, partial [Sticta canariensis]|nr:hypothetical protein [Sticta canariensis]